MERERNRGSSQPGGGIQWGTLIPGNSDTVCLLEIESGSMLENTNKAIALEGFDVEQLDAKVSDLILGGCGCPEQDHWDADRLLVTLLRHLGFRKTANAFESIDKWYA